MDKKTSWTINISSWSSVEKGIYNIYCQFYMNNNYVKFEFEIQRLHTYDESTDNNGAVYKLSLYIRFTIYICVYMCRYMYI